MVSVLIHLTLVLVVIGLSHSLLNSKSNSVDFIVYQQAVQQKGNEQIKKSIEPKQKSKKAEQIISEGSSSSQQDLSDSGVESEGLPHAVSDSLITQDASIKYEPLKKERTEEARKNGYTGKAYLQILIDREGIVREVKILNELKYGLSEKARELALQTRFNPAKIKEEPVAVSRQFSVTFKATD